MLGGKEGGAHTPPNARLALPPLRHLLQGGLGEHQQRGAGRPQDRRRQGGRGAAARRLGPCGAEVCERCRLRLPDAGNADV